MIPDPPNTPDPTPDPTTKTGKFSSSQLVDAVVLAIMIVCVTILAFAGKIPPTLLGVVYAGSLGWVGAKVTNG